MNIEIIMPKHFTIDQSNKRAIVNGRKVELSPKELKLIELLLTDVTHVFSAKEIINHLWPDNKRVLKADLYQYIHLLRKKLEEDSANPQWLVNIAGFGYKLAIDTTEKHYKKVDKIMTNESTMIEEHVTIDDDGCLYKIRYERSPCGELKITGNGIKILQNGIKLDNFFFLRDFLNKVFDPGYVVIKDRVK